MNFVVLGEVSDRISDEVKSGHPNVLWKKIKGFQNLIAHEYLGIDAEAVWHMPHSKTPKASNRRGFCHGSCLRKNACQYLAFITFQRC